MSQCCPRQRWASLATKLCSFSFHVMLMAVLVGCSMAELEKLATEKDHKKSSASSYRDTTQSQNVGDELLSPESIILGGSQSLGGYAGQFQRMFIGKEDEIKLIEPVAVGGTGGLLYIVDAGAGIVYKYDLAVDDIVPVKDIAVHFKGNMGNIYVAKDRSFYIVDSIGQQVLHFSEMGELKTRFQDFANLSRPIDVLVDEENGDVLVADGSFSHIVVFNELGKTVKAIGQRGTGPGRFRAITSMTRGEDGLFLLDRLELPAQVITLNGDFKYSFGESDLVFPTAIAVDQDQRVYISDRSDNSIRVYQHGQLLMKYGHGGSAPGRFRIITGLWVSGYLLYVADSLNGRVQVLRINPNAPVELSPLN
jgi:DNA-binding beta-propeller fold protein YncE